MSPHDVVAYRDEVKRKLFGDMEVVRSLSNNRVLVRIALRKGERRVRSRSAKHWQEYESDLELVERRTS